MYDFIGNGNVNFDVICKRVFQRHASDIEALNKSQLDKGLRSDEKVLPAYRKSYLKTRRKYGRPTAPTDLNLKGDFREKFFSIYLNSYMNIGSKDPKAGLLEGKYGQNIFGLTSENMGKLLWDYGCAYEIVEETVLEMFT